MLVRCSSVAVFSTTEVAMVNSKKNGQDNDEYRKQGINKMKKPEHQVLWHIAPNEIAWKTFGMSILKIKNRRGKLFSKENIFIRRN